MSEVHKGITQPTKGERQQRGNTALCPSLSMKHYHAYSYKLHLLDFSKKKKLHLLDYVVMVFVLAPIFLQETLGIICFVSTRSLYWIEKLSNESRRESERRCGLSPNSTSLVCLAL